MHWFVVRWMVEVLGLQGSSWISAIFLWRTMTSCLTFLLNDMSEEHRDSWNSSTGLLQKSPRTKIHLLYKWSSTGKKGRIFKICFWSLWKVSNWDHILQILQTDISVIHKLHCEFHKTFFYLQTAFSLSPSSKYHLYFYKLGFL